MRYTLLFCAFLSYGTKLCAEDLQKARFAWSLGEDWKELKFLKSGKYQLTEKITAMPSLVIFGQYRIEKDELHLLAQKCDIDVSGDFRKESGADIERIRNSVCNYGFKTGVCIFIPENHAAYQRSIKCRGSDPNGSYAHADYPLILYDHATRPKIGTEIDHLNIPVIAENKKFMIMHRASSYILTASPETVMTPKITVFISNQYPPGEIVQAYAISRFMYAYENHKCQWLLIRNSFGNYHWIPKNAVNGH